MQAEDVEKELDLDGLLFIGGDDQTLTHASLVNNLGSVLRLYLICVLHLEIYKIFLLEFTV
jgi:hypothetical protein